MEARATPERGTFADQAEHKKFSGPNFMGTSRLEAVKETNFSGVERLPGLVGTNSS